MMNSPEHSQVSEQTMSLFRDGELCDENVTFPRYGQNTVRYSSGAVQCFRGNVTHEFTSEN
jgi:hypothetical protein